MARLYPVERKWPRTDATKEARTDATKEAPHWCSERGHVPVRQRSPHWCNEGGHVPVRVSVDADKAEVAVGVP